MCVSKMGPPSISTTFTGQLLAVVTNSARHVEIFSTDAPLVREIVYLTILSRVSERLEFQGLHRGTWTRN